MEAHALRQSLDLASVRQRMIVAGEQFGASRVTVVVPESSLGGAEREDDVKMALQIDGPTEALEKRHRPRLDLLSFTTACDRLAHVILRNRGTENGMDVRSQVL
jgi:hypothetical protein